MRLLHASAIALSSLMILAASPVVPSDKPTSDPSQPQPVVESVEQIVADAGNLMDLKRWDEAIQLLTFVLEIDPDNGTAYANRALCYGWTNRLEEASRDLAAAEKLIPNRAIIYRVRAVIADRKSDEDTELVELSKSLELEPDNPMALRFRAWILNRKGKEAEALADADSYIRHRPQSPDAYALKADLLRAQMKLDLAAEEAKRLDSLFPGNAYAMAASARIYSAVGDRTRALQEITSAIGQEPESFYYYYLRAKFRRWDDVAGRRKDLLTAMALQPNDLGTTTELGLLEFQQERWSQAIAMFSIIMTLEPKDYGVLAYRGMAREKQGNRATAQRDYEAAMAAASGASDFSLICDVLGFEGVALDRALQACNRAIELDPGDGAYRSTRGIVHLRLRNLDAALADFDFANSKDPRRAIPFYGRAIVHWRKGDKVGAMADLRQARRIDPTIDETFRKHGIDDLPQSDSPAEPAAEANEPASAER